MKHTPGPWELNTSGKAVLARENGHGRFTVCVMQNPHIAEQEANAWLIAAAPDLLSAAQQLLLDADDRGETRDRSTGERYGDWERLRAAIGKAQG